MMTGHPPCRLCGGEMPMVEMDVGAQMNQLRVALRGSRAPGNKSRGVGRGVRGRAVGLGC
jgi:hypothetical protein